MSLIWHPATEQEFAYAALFYDRRQTGLGEEFVDEVSRTALEIVADPERASMFDPPYRKVATERFSYQLIYEIKGSDVRIIAVMHQHRRPGYWKEREVEWE